MNSKPRVVLVTANDWEGLYINGRLAVENHHLRPREILEVLADAGALTFSETGVNQDWLEGVGSLPEALEDLAKEE